MTNLENQPVPEFADKKTRYFSNFAKHHLSDMRILKQGGVLGKENADWRNVAEHCLVVAVAADVLAEALSADRAKVVEAALLHDWFKRREVEAMKAAGGGKGYELTAGEDERLLREQQIPEETIEVTHANIPKSAEEESLASRSPEEKIMHFVDAITSGTDFVSVNERFDLLEQKPRNVEFSESFRTKLGEPLYGIQRRVTAAEQTEFEDALGLPAGTLIDFIKEKIEERIENQDA